MIFWAKTSLCVVDQTCSFKVFSCCVLLLEANHLFSHSWHFSLTSTVSRDRDLSSKACSVKLHVETADPKCGEVSWSDNFTLSWEALKSAGQLTHCLFKSILSKSEKCTRRLLQVQTAFVMSMTRSLWIRRSVKGNGGPVEIRFPKSRRRVFRTASEVSDCFRASPPSYEFLLVFKTTSLSFTQCSFVCKVQFKLSPLWEAVKFLNAIKSAWSDCCDWTHMWGRAASFSVFRTIVCFRLKIVLKSDFIFSVLSRGETRLADWSGEGNEVEPFEVFDTWSDSFGESAK